MIWHFPIKLWKHRINLGKDDRNTVQRVFSSCWLSERENETIYIESLLRVNYVILNFLINFQGNQIFFEFSWTPDLNLNYVIKSIKSIFLIVYIMISHVRDIILKWFYLTARTLSKSRYHWKSVQNYISKSLLIFSCKRNKTKNKINKAFLLCYIK